jgi:hypothetical protein
MRFAFLLFMLAAVAGCAASPTAAYDAIAESYCRQKAGEPEVKGCALHMKTGYLTNEEINYINEKSRWWTGREGP